MAESKFTPSVRVAVDVSPRFSRQTKYREDFVLKVHKSGRFTLKSDPRQQWTPRSDGKSAHRSGQHMWGGRSTLTIWDEEMDEVVRRANMKEARIQRLEAVRKQIESVGWGVLAREDDRFEKALLLLEVAADIVVKEIQEDGR